MIDDFMNPFLRAVEGVAGRLPPAAVPNAATATGPQVADAGGQTSGVFNFLVAPVPVRVQREAMAWKDRKSAEANAAASGAEQAERAARLEILSAVREAQQKMPNAAPNVVFNSVIQNPRFLKNALSVPGDKMIALVQEMQTALAPPAPEKPTAVPSGTALVERYQPPPSEMDPSPQPGYREVYANRQPEASAQQSSSVVAVHSVVPLPLALRNARDRAKPAKPAKSVSSKRSEAMKAAWARRKAAQAQKNAGPLPLAA